MWKTQGFPFGISSRNAWETQCNQTRLAEKSLIKCFFQEFSMGKSLIFHRDFQPLDFQRLPWNFWSLKNWTQKPWCMEVWWGNRIVNYEKHRKTMITLDANQLCMSNDRTIVAKNAVLRGPTIQKMLVLSQNYIVRLFFLSSTMVFHGVSIYFSGTFMMINHIFHMFFHILPHGFHGWFPHFMNPQPSTPSGWSTWHQGVVTRP